MQHGAPHGTATEPLDAARARLFALLGRLLVAPPDAPLLARLAALPADPSPIGAALGALADLAARTTPAAVTREFHDVFVGVGRGELLPYASYYLTGFLHERPLAQLRAELARLGVTRAPGIAEPEDHLGFGLEVAAGLLDGRLDGGPASADALLARHLAPWAGRCFADLEAAPSARFYRPVGTLGRTLFEIEAAANALPA